MPLDEKIREMRRYKSIGNEYFDEGHFDRALIFYRRVFACLRSVITAYLGSYYI